MSWSVSGIGKAAPLGVKLANDFEKITYLGPEEGALKDAAAEVVAKVINANTLRGATLKIDASGSGSTHPADGNQQTLSISIQPVYGFVE